MRWAVRLTKPVLLLVAFALSIVLYLYVQPKIDTTTARLVVHATGLDQRLVFDDEGSPVEFSVTGPRDQIDRLNTKLAADAQSVKATVDLSRITPKMVEVNPYMDLQPIAHPGADLDLLKFKPVRPLKTKVEEPATRLNVPIKVELLPSAASSAVSANAADSEDFEVEPRTVNLTGPASQLKNVEPTVSINADDVERSGVGNFPLELKVSAYAGSLPVVTNPRVEKVEVRATHHQRPVYVNIKFIGRVAEGYVVTNQYVVEGSERGYTAVLRGPGTTIDQVGAIDAVVDISGLRAPGFLFTVNPKLPPRAELVDSPLQIRVDVAKTRR